MPDRSRQRPSQVTPPRSDLPEASRREPSVGTREGAVSGRSAPPLEPARADSPAPKQVPNTAISSVESQALSKILQDLIQTIPRYPDRGGVEKTTDLDHVAGAIPPSSGRPTNPEHEAHEDEHHSDELPLKEGARGVISAPSGLEGERSWIDGRDSTVVSSRPIAILPPRRSDSIVSAGGCRRGSPRCDDRPARGDSGTRYSRRDGPRGGHPGPPRARHRCPRD